ncbi:MAG: DMT family transporter [Pirellulales bacterium]
MTDRFAWLLPASAVVAGFVLAVQPAANGALAKRCGHPLQASVISFGTGFLAVLLIAGILRIGWPTWSRFAGLPWWAWTGGLMGVYVVTSSLYTAPRIGSANWIALVIAGQIALSLLLDHFGWMGFAHHPLSWQRILGAVALAVGVALVLKS